MLKTKNLVPSVYYNQSRDFQFLGRTFDAVFNYLKMNIDLIEALPLSQNSDDTMIPLLAKTLGFNVRHTYDTQDLKSICSVFSDLVRNKGSKSAIENAGKTLMNTQNIGGYFKVDINTDTVDNPYTVNLYVPPDLKDTILLEDLFDYILPAGFEYRFIKSTFADNSPKDTIDVSEKIKPFNLSNDNIGKIAKPNDNILRPDMIDVEEGTIDTTSEIATTFTGKIISGK